MESNLPPITASGLSWEVMHGTVWVKRKSSIAAIGSSKLDWIALSTLLQSSITFHFLFNWVLQTLNPSPSPWSKTATSSFGRPFLSRFVITFQRQSIDRSYIAIDLRLGRRQALLCPSMRIRTIVRSLFRHVTFTSWACDALWRSG